MSPSEREDVLEIKELENGKGGMSHMQSNGESLQVERVSDMQNVLHTGPGIEGEADRFLSLTRDYLDEIKRLQFAVGALIEKQQSQQTYMRKIEDENTALRTRLKRTTLELADADQLLKDLSAPIARKEIEAGNESDEIKLGLWAGRVRDYFGHLYFDELFMGEKE